VNAAQLVACAVCVFIFAAIAMWIRNKDRHPPP